MKYKKPCFQDRVFCFLNLIIPFVTSYERKKLEVHFNRLWTVVCQPLTCLKFNNQSDGRKDGSARIHDGFELVATRVCRIHSQVALRISDWDHERSLFCLEVVGVLDVKIPVQIPSVKKVLFINANVKLMKRLQPDAIDS